ncbi:MAG: lysophospholipid acyltransferase family protein [Desulfobacterales bacterium]|nr:lysophospholipid acyltransferase family protein [Desulfobacterales bacterium]
MNRYLRYLYGIYKWLVMIPVLGISTFVCGMSVVALVWFIRPAILARLFARSWARINSWFTPMLVKVEGRHHIDPAQSYVIVCNHQSQYDIFVLYGWLDIDFKWVMKQELRNIPVIGIACDKLGHIYVDRSNREAALKSIQAAKSRISDGTSVLFFPEGTRSRDGRLRDFKKGAFHFALDLQLPLLPITINGTRAILPSDTLDLFPGRATMMIHAPIGIEGFARSNIDELAARVRQSITAGLAPSTPV